MLARVGELAEAELIRFVTTDLTILEVAKKHCMNDYELVRDFGRDHVRQALTKALGVDLPNVTKSDLEKSLREKYRADVQSMFEALSCEVLPVNEVKPLKVFTEYNEGKGFFTGQGKKDQFPDAFILERVKQVVTDDSQLIIVAADRDYVVPTGPEERIELAISIPELFGKLGLEMDAPQVEDFLSENEQDLISFVDSELNDWGLIADVQEAYIEETQVTNLSVRDLIAFKSVFAEEPILAVATLETKLIAHFSHPDWDNAMYDSEDKVLIPFEDVTGEAEVQIEIEVSLEIALDDAGVPESIESLEFRNSDFQYVDLYQPDDFK